LLIKYIINIYKLILNFEHEDARLSSAKCGEKSQQEAIQ